jgi:hypothetical protein
MKFLITFRAKKADHSAVEYMGLFQMAQQYARTHSKKIDPECTYIIKVQKKTGGKTVWAKVDDDGNIEGGGQVE